jgi:hypothetical protein
MSKINFAGRGGASDGLAYFAIIKELVAKAITGGIVALVSAATVMFGLWACGYSAEEARDILKVNMKDWVMKMEEEAEGKNPGKKEGFLRRGLKYLISIIAFKTSFGKKMQRAFVTIYTWEKVKAAKRVDKLYIGFTTREDVNKFDSGLSPLDFFKDMAEALKAGGSQAKYEKAYQNIRMFWASDDGVYTVNPFTNSFEKYSDDIIPLGMSILYAFKNPALRKDPVVIRGEKLIPFDLGIINNESNIVFIGKPEITFYQFSCDYPPTKDFIQGKTKLSDYVFNKCRPADDKICVVKPSKERGFFAFYDEAIDEEFFYQKQSDFIKIS